MCKKTPADRRNNKNLKNNSMNVFNSLLFFWLQYILTVNPADVCIFLVDIKNQTFSNFIYGAVVV